MAQRMNPYSNLPKSVRRRLETTTRNLKESRLKANVIVRSPIDQHLETIPAAEAVKPLRGRKEGLPQADEVDPKFILRRSDPGANAPAAPPASASTDGAEPAAVNTSIDFDGGFFGDPATIPPDTHGAPGVDVVMSTLNNRVWWHDRDGAELGDTSLDDFWNVFDDVEIEAFDPKLFHDELTGRFIFVVCGNARRPDSSVLVAVSEGSDPRGNWIYGRIEVDHDEMGDVWMDYPSVGFTEDKITISLNLFTNDDYSEFKAVAIFVIDKPAFLNSPNDFVFDQFVVTDQGGTFCPAIVCDPGVFDQYLVSSWSGNSGGSSYLALYKISGGIQDATVNFERVGFLEVDQTWKFSSDTDIAPQKDSPHQINVGDARIQWVVHRRGRLTLAHTALVPDVAPTHAAVLWADVDLEGTPAVIDHGLIGGVTGDMLYAFPSVAVNHQGDTAIGMAAFSDTMFASGAYTVRLAGGAFSPPVIYAPGKNTYHLTYDGSRNRWGDYSSTHVDPANGTDFWTLQEYVGDIADEWRVRWGRIGIPPTGAT